VTKGYGFITPDAGKNSLHFLFSSSSCHQNSPATIEPKSWLGNSLLFSLAAGGEDLFVHQSAIQSEGFRSLREGEPVEFFIETSDDGRAKAVQVTGPNGANPEGAPRRQFNDYNGGGGGFGGGGGGRGGGGFRGGRGGGGAYGGGGGYGNGGYGGGGYGGGYEQQGGFGGY
jgi:cold shock CspA family protein